MRKVKTLSISLEPAYIAKLAKIAARRGGTSAAVRFLIDAHEKAERDRDLDELYHEYYSDPKNIEDCLAWTRDMLRIASLGPAEFKERRDERRKRAAR